MVNITLNPNSKSLSVSFSAWVRWSGDNDPQSQTPSTSLIPGIALGNSPNPSPNPNPDPNPNPKKVVNLGPATSAFNKGITVDTAGGINILGAERYVQGTGCCGEGILRAHGV